MWLVVPSSLSPLCVFLLLPVHLPFSHPLFLIPPPSSLLSMAPNFLSHPLLLPSPLHFLCLPPLPLFSQGFKRELEELESTESLNHKIAEKNAEMRRVKQQLDGIGDRQKELLEEKGQQEEIMRLGRGVGGRGVAMEGGG